MVHMVPSGPSRKRSRSCTSCTEDDAVAGGSIHTSVALIPPGPAPLEPPATAAAASSSDTTNLRSSSSNAATWPRGTPDGTAAWVGRWVVVFAYHTWENIKY